MRVDLDVHSSAAMSDVRARRGLDRERVVERFDTPVGGVLPRVGVLVAAR